MTKGPITSHVLDISRGQPAAGIVVELEWLAANGEWQSAGMGTTNSDGRVLNLIEPDAFNAGKYRLIFATADYFTAQNVKAFYPQVTIEFTVSSASEHYHVPLLLSPFGYSTYRGS